MKIAIYHATAGYGHRKAAEAIYHGLLSNGFAESDLLIVDSLDRTPSFFKYLYPTFYYESVKWTPGLWGFFYDLFDHPFIYSLLRPIRSLGNRLVGSKLIKDVMEWKPDVIISTHFMTAELFATAKRRDDINAKLMTVITDFMPHTFWVNDGTDHYTIMESEGKTDLLRRGIPDSAVSITGIPVDPAFKGPFNKDELYQKHQLDSNKTTLLLTSGSFGLGHYEAIIEKLAAFKEHLQCILICGQNKVEYDKCKTIKWPMTVQVYGFVDFMAELMAISDMILAKPGGATSAESLATRVPMMIFKPIPGQESRNAEILSKRKAGYPVSTPDDVYQVVKKLVDDHDDFHETREQMSLLSKPNATDEIIQIAKELVP